MRTRFFYIGLIVISVIISCLLYGFYIEPKRLVITSVKVETRNYQGPPLKIAFVSDLHVGGRHVSPQRVLNIMDTVHDNNPDIIILGGDYVAGHKPIDAREAEFVNQIALSIEHLGHKKPHFGTYAVLGNHDVWYDATTIETLLSQQVTVLSNAAFQFGNLCIVGLEDEDTQSPNSVAFSDCEANSDIIAVMHSPDSFRLVPSNVALALAGHTHGGQINLPIIGRAVTSTRTGKRYAYGAVETPSGVKAFVTAGIGTSILSARFRSPPEIVLIYLS